MTAVSCDTTEVPVADELEMRLVQCARIHPSPYQARKTFDEAGLAELAKSIASKGVLQPVLLRPHPSIRGHYELIYGERRLRASILAGRAMIPAMIRKLDDKTAAEIGIIENDSRQNLHPLEQAAAYWVLLSYFSHDVDSIALSIGRTKKYVASRLQLTNLMPELQADLQSDKLPFGHAYLLATLSHDIQRLLWEGKLKACLYDYMDRAVRLDVLKKAIKAGFVASLSAAPWKLDDATLVPKAGSCTACPHRSGRNPTLFDWVDEELDEPGPVANKKLTRDYCTNRLCYEQKTSVFLDLTLRATEAAQPNVATPRLSCEQWPRDKSLVSVSNYEIVNPKATRYKSSDLVRGVIMDGDQIGQVVTVKLQQPQAKVSESASTIATSKRTAWQQRDVLSALATEAVATVANTALRKFRATSSLNHERKLIRALVQAIVEMCGDREARLVCKRRGLKSDIPQLALIQLVGESEESELQVADLLALLAELVATRKSANWGTPFKVTDAEWWSNFGVNVDEMMREQEAKTSGNRKGV